MGRCNAFVVDTAERCKKKALAGSNYCFLHYPIKSLVFSVLIGAIVGLMFTVLFREPLLDGLLKIPVFQYLDKDNPIILGFIPDVKTNNIFHDLSQFIIEAEDRGTGIDKQKTLFTLKKNGGNDSIPGTMSLKGDKLEYLLEDRLEAGEYLLEGVVFDKANNKTFFKHEFIVKPKVDLLFNVRRFDYPHTSNPEEYFFEEAKNVDVKYFKPAIIEIYLVNNTENIRVQNMWLDINAHAIVYASKVLGSSQVKEIVQYEPTSERNKHLDKEQIASTKRNVRIEEIMPAGMLRIALLIGEHSIHKPENLSINGTYEWKAYGQSGYQQIKEDFRIQSTSIFYKTWSFRTMEDPQKERENNVEAKSAKEDGEPVVIKIELKGK